GLQRSSHSCFDHEAGRCDGACCGKVKPQEYNLRIEKALDGFKVDSRSYAIIGEGRSVNECSVIVLEDGKYLGFGFLEKEKLPDDFLSAKEFIEHYKDNREVQSIIQSYLKKNHDYKVLLAT